MYNNIFVFIHSEKLSSLIWNLLKLKLPAANILTLGEF